jgi:nicotinamide mononucleotide transporter PnuC
MTIYGWWNWTHPLASPCYRKERDVLFSESENVTAPLAHREGQGESLEVGREEAPVSHFPLRLALLWTVITLAAWGLIYLFLVTCTDSRVPVADSFTTALSLVGIWALAHKYLEQWFVWIVVDVVTCALYFYKDIPFKASLYGLYVVIAVMGYFKWKRMMTAK